MNSRLVKGYLFAVLSAVIYGCMPLMAAYIYADGVNSFTLVFLRNLFAIVPLALLAYRQRKTLAVPRKLLPAIALMGALGCCITPILLFTSYGYIPSGTATVFHFAYPAIVVIGEMLLLKKKKGFFSLLSVFLCVIGICLFYSPGQSLNPAGSILAIASAFTFAGYVILLSRFDSSRVSGFLFTLYITLISCALSLGFCLATDNLALPASPTGWGLCVLFALLVTTGAVVLFQQSAFLIGGDRASILSTLEPITSLVIGFALFREPMGPRVLLGSALVVLASILTALSDLNKSTKA